MNRCAPLLSVLALAAFAPAHAAQATTLVASTSSATATADNQSLQRHFPRNALRGRIVFGTPPAIALDGSDTQMAAGYRIHGTNNLIVMSAQLVGLKAIVNYTTNMQGQVNEVWILTPAEAAKLWPRTTTEAADWSFDPIAQVWTK